MGHTGIGARGRRLELIAPSKAQECKKVESLDEICSLANLRRLLLTDFGTVASIRCLAELTQLEEILFYGSTNVKDGDLNCLTRQPNLKNLAFQNRRHYTHRREVFEQP